MITDLDKSAKTFVRGYNDHQDFRAVCGSTASAPYLAQLAGRRKNGQHLERGMTTVADFGCQCPEPRNSILQRVSR
jgi:hypothetical protein